MSQGPESFFDNPLKPILNFIKNRFGNKYAWLAVGFILLCFLLYKIYPYFRIYNEDLKKSLILDTQLIIERSGQLSFDIYSEKTSVSPGLSGDLRVEQKIISSKNSPCIFEVSALSYGDAAKRFRQSNDKSFTFKKEHKAKISLSQVGSIIIQEITDINIAFYPFSILTLESGTEVYLKKAALSKVDVKEVKISSKDINISWPIDLNSSSNFGLNKSYPSELPYWSFYIKSYDAEEFKNKFLSLVDSCKAE